MRILLIMADAHMHKMRLGPFVRSMREAPLILTTLAALAADTPGLAPDAIRTPTGTMPAPGSFTMLVYGR
jgi:hypothetical protein